MTRFLLHHALAISHLSLNMLLVKHIVTIYLSRISVLSLK